MDQLHVPAYLGCLIKPKENPRRLRSSQQNLLEVPPDFHKTTLGKRSFKFASASVWNKLPETIKNSTSLTMFKKKLKTHLFKMAFLSQ